MLFSLAYLISNFTYMDEYVISGFEDVNNGTYVGDGVWYRDIEGGYASSDWDFIPETADFVSDDNSSAGNAARISINTGGSAGDDWIQIRVDFSLTDPDGDGNKGWNLADYDYLALRVKAPTLQTGAGYRIYLQVEDADKDRKQCADIDPSITISDTNGWKIFLYPKSSFTYNVYTNGDGVIDWSKIYFFYIQVNDAPDDPTSSPNVILLDRLSAFRSSYWHIDWSNGGGRWYISSPHHITFNAGDPVLSDQVQVGIEFSIAQDLSDYDYFVLWAGYVNPTASGTWRIGLIFEDSDGTRTEVHQWWANDVYLVDSDLTLRRYIFPKSSYTNNIFAGADDVLNWASIKKIFVQFDDSEDSENPVGQTLSVQYLEAYPASRFALSYSPGSISGGTVDPGTADVEVATGTLNYQLSSEDFELVYSQGEVNATLEIQYAGAVNYGSDSDVDSLNLTVGTASFNGTFSDSQFWRENLSQALAPGTTKDFSLKYDVSSSATGGDTLDGAVLVPLSVGLHYPEVSYDSTTSNLTSMFPWWGGGASRPSTAISDHGYYSSDALNITYNWGSDSANSGWAMIAKDVWRYDLSHLSKIVIYVNSSSSNTGYITVKLREAHSTADYELPNWVGNASYSLSFDGWKKFVFDVEKFSKTPYGTDPVAGLQKDQIQYLIVAIDEGGADADTSSADHVITISDIALVCEYDSSGSYTIGSSNSSGGSTSSGSGSSGTSAASEEKQTLPKLSSGQMIAYPSPVSFSKGRRVILVAGYNEYLPIDRTEFYVFSFTGEFVAKLVAKGTNYVSWDGRSFAGKRVGRGIYFVVAKVVYADSSFVKTKPFKILIKR